VCARTRIGTGSANWEPPNRVGFTWHDPDWIAETEVEVTFEPNDDGTTVLLTHRGFERVGGDWRFCLGRWCSGWPHVLAVFRDHGRR
jgi:uncharacterized protein YndB with AHSA1/START domain